MRHNKNNKTDYSHGLRHCDGQVRFPPAGIRIKVTKTCSEFEWAKNSAQAAAGYVQIQMG